ncbi:hypothetical protein IMZ48_44935 [Candidatus Bathyarchaeota archaeon]|nr:hypothetical protein [Candidatus Bathyarchaeota archaeon]
MRRTDRSTPSTRASDARMNFGFDWPKRTEERRMRELAERQFLVIENRVRSRACVESAHQRTRHRRMRTPASRHTPSHCRPRSQPAWSWAVEQKYVVLVVWEIALYAPRLRAAVPANKHILEVVSQSTISTRVLLQGLEFSSGASSAFLEKYAS